MITFSILTTILLAVAIVAAIVALAFGGGFVVVFGDLIVCGFIIWALVKLFRRKK